MHRMWEVRAHEARPGERGNPRTATAARMIKSCRRLRGRTGFKSFDSASTKTSVRMDTLSDPCDAVCVVASEVGSNPDLGNRH